jgi:hypothetical protein
MQKHVVPTLIAIATVTLCIVQYRAQHSAVSHDAKMDAPMPPTATPVPVAVESPDNGDAPPSDASGPLARGPDGLMHPLVSPPACMFPPKPIPGFFQRNWVLGEIFAYLCLGGFLLGGGTVFVTASFGPTGNYQGFSRTYVPNFLPVAIPGLVLLLYTLFYWGWVFPHTGHGDIGRCAGAIVDTFFEAMRSCLS